VWKLFQLLPQDRDAAQTPEQKDHTGCLITEVVIPGFDPKDHAFLTTEGLEELFKGVEGGDEKVKELRPYIRKTA